MIQFQGVYPISGENLYALPVKAIGPAVTFYQTILGFRVKSSNDMTAMLLRDDFRLGLVRNPDHKPDEAGSCAITVAELDAMRKELEGLGIDLSPIRIDEWSGKKYRVFFLREAENGYCYCFNQPLQESSHVG